MPVSVLRWRCRDIAAGITDGEAHEESDDESDGDPDMPPGSLGGNSGQGLLLPEAVGTYSDNDRKTVYRQSGLGDEGLTFRWPDRVIRVYWQREGE